MAHQLISSRFNSIKYAVDATCGNGYDSLFLSRMCDNDGMIYCFDIQVEAINNTASLLKSHRLFDKVRIIRSGHEDMLNHIGNKVSVIVFNLGYLPNSGREIATNYGTTIKGLDSSLKLLEDRGIISIICYPKQNSGRIESEYIKNWTCSLSDEKYKVSIFLSENPDMSTPILYLIESK